MLKQSRLIFILALSAALVSSAGAINLPDPQEGQHGNSLWEKKFLEGLLKKTLKLQVFSVKLSTGSDASLWQFDMPEGMNAEAKKQVYLTVVRRPYVLLLNSAVTGTMSEDLARKFLLDTMATLQISPGPIDVRKLSESIRKGV